MEKQEPIYKVSTRSKEVIGGKNQLLDFLKEIPVGDRIFIERVYTIEEYKSEEENTMPF